MRDTLVGRYLSFFITLIICDLSEKSETVRLILFFFFLGEGKDCLNSATAKIAAAELLEFSSFCHNYQAKVRPLKLILGAKRDIIAII